MVLGLAFCGPGNQQGAGTAASDTMGVTTVPPAAETMPPAGTVPPGAPGTALSPGEVGAILSASDSAEIRPSQLAQDKAQHPEVKAYAQRMIRDHGMLEDSLRALEKGRNITPAPSTISQQLHQMTESAVQRLQGLSGAEFDRAYMQNMVQSHEQALNMVDNQLLPATQDPQLRQAIEQKVRPIIVGHLQSAQEIQRTLGSGSQQTGSH
jgi:putative membrane protein